MDEAGLMCASSAEGWTLLAPCSDNEQTNTSQGQQYGGGGGGGGGREGEFSKHSFIKAGLTKPELTVLD